jgi:RNA polymerase sigma-70 factor (ECF subfamily)
VETDDQLLAAYRAGDVEALERLVVRHQRSLFGYVLQMTEGRDDPEDIFQEVWLRVIRKAASYRRGNFGGWLMRIARNLVIDRARRRRPDRSLDEEDPQGRPLRDTLPAAGTGAGAELAAAETGRRIEAALRQLPPVQREVFVMRTQMDLPFREIARIQNVSINTALARMQYALRKLRPLLAEEYEGVAGGAQPS